ncbi:hypothetical protein PBY51_017215 [Eleginops maclovinus]|uniref:Uncharacterized protein n=1 Tax=Eleginops maclovinus TaxID=56733 RepID=A0AAN8ANQ7_ELEMC|nr:hypothetical protein PBY51_017215 [Eleginops maclovinus]
MLCVSAPGQLMLSAAQQTTTEHMTGALSQLFLPWRSPSSPTHTAVQSWISPCGHRGDRLSSAEKKERGRRQGGLGDGGE